MNFPVYNATICMALKENGFSNGIHMLYELYNNWIEGEKNHNKNDIMGK